MATASYGMVFFSLFWKFCIVGRDFDSLAGKKKQCGSDGGGMLPGIHEPIAQTNDQYPPSKGKTEKFKTCLEKRGRAKNKNGLLDPVFSSILSADLSFILMVLSSASRKFLSNPFCFCFSKKGTTPLPKHYRLLTLYT